MMAVLKIAFLMSFIISNDACCSEKTHVCNNFVHLSSIILLEDNDTSAQERRWWPKIGNHWNLALNSKVPVSLCQYPMMKFEDGCQQM